jgi:hypothetical protein
MKEFLGLVYSLSLILSICFGIGMVFGMMMNGARNFDLAGPCLVGALFFGGIAWLALYFVGIMA